MVPEQRVKTCCYKVCRTVTEECSKEVQYKVCTLVKECRTRQVPVCKTFPVHYTKSIDVVRYVPTRVPYTVTRCVPTTICREVPLCE
jgi:hypothetical protein